MSKKNSKKHLRALWLQLSFLSGCPVDVQLDFWPKRDRERSLEAGYLSVPLGKKHGEEDQSGQEPVDDRYRQLQEELRLIDENMASRRTKIEALMEQLRMIWGGQVLGASASANP